MLENVKTERELAWFLGIGLKELKELVPENHYTCFQIPKDDKGGKRMIEAPAGILLRLLDRLADGLQWHYSDHRTHPAHGFIRAYPDDPDKRTIFTNASRHLGRKYLLNIDLDNFFHQVTEPKVHGIFADHRFFRLTHATVELITRLVCYHDRLPMGSPTSPPLSNFAVYDLDLDLARWSVQQRIVFTRFVDDLSFSANYPLKKEHFDAICDMLWMHRFVPDPEKIRWFGKNDTKEVTGLLVGSEISLPPEYLGELSAEIQRLKSVREYTLLYPDLTVFDWVKKLERVVAGRLAFVKAVYGEEAKEYKTLNNSLKEIELSEPPPQSLSWRYAGYEYFSA